MEVALSEERKHGISDQSTSNNSPLKGNLSHKSSVLPHASNRKSLVPVKVEDPSSSSYRHSPRKATRSPGLPLYRQISDSRIPSSKGSHGGSDEWSMHTFFELLASFQRERWSFNDEYFKRNGKILGSIFDYESDILPNLQTCGICLKLLESSPICSYPVVAVLACGHVFHAECLERLAPCTVIHNPHCQVCEHNCQSEVKAKKDLIHQAAFAGTNGEGNSSSGHRKRSEKGVIVGASSSTKSLLSRPFPRRHLSVGLRPASSSRKMR